MNCVKICTTQDWNQHVVNSPKPVVVSFFADWCAPCHKLNPQLLEEAKKNADNWQLAFVDVENEDLYEVVQQIAEAQIPSVHVMNKGTKIDSITGYSQRKTKTFLDKLTSK